MSLSGVHMGAFPLEYSHLGRQYPFPIALPISVEGWSLIFSGFHALLCYKTTSCHEDERKFTFL